MSEPSAGGGVPVHERPWDDTPVDTAELPDTPLRDRRIPARAWRQAPASLLALGDDLPDRPEAGYLRRLGPWLLWRAGPASKGRARYWVAPLDDLERPLTFDLFPDGTGDGVGPTGTRHTRFRTWKQDLAGNAPATGS